MILRHKIQSTLITSGNLAWRTFDKRTTDEEVVVVEEMEARGNNDDRVGFDGVAGYYLRFVVVIC